MHTTLHGPTYPSTTDISASDLILDIKQYQTHLGSIRGQYLSLMCRMSDEHEFDHADHRSPYTPHHLMLRLRIEFYQSFGFLVIDDLAVDTHSYGVFDHKLFGEMINAARLKLWIIRAQLSLAACIEKIRNKP